MNPTTISHSPKAKRPIFEHANIINIGHDHGEARGKKCVQ